MDALLDRLRVIRAFDITTVMSALVSYMDGVTEGVRPYIVQQSTACVRACFYAHHTNRSGPNFSHQYYTPLSINLFRGLLGRGHGWKTPHM